MRQAVLPGDPPVQITLRRSARARRVSLRVSGLDGRVTLSMPTRMNATTALAFAEEKLDWIHKQLAARPLRVDVKIGGLILFRGQELPIIAGAARRAAIRDGSVCVPDAPAMVGARIKALLRLTAGQELSRACEFYADRLGCRFGRITLRDTRSRWGSCSSGGNLMFSWRLAMTPPDVLDYVAAHEVAHLVELNHSPAYWAEVARICPGYAAPRTWLRANGQLLHRYLFDG